LPYRARIVSKFAIDVIPNRHDARMMYIRVKAVKDFNVLTGLSGSAGTSWIAVEKRWPCMESFMTSCSQLDQICPALQIHSTAGSSNSTISIITFSHD